MVDLIKLSTEELLGKFGSGNHKPGSGSAAAFQGMLSAQLIKTVIDLSKQKENYREWWPQFNQMALELENRIYPNLLHFFQLDSEQFDRVIQLRRQRDEETNPSKRKELIKALDDALLPATQTPIAIAKLCAELAGFAVFICDHGFQAARGDSGVALNNSIATITGCLSIINLNLLSLGDDEETEQIRLEATLLKTAQTELSDRANERLIILEKQAQRHREFHQELKILSSGIWAGSKLTYNEIEELARRLQNTLWKYSDKIFKQTDSESLIELLKPQVVLTKILNYQYEEPENLGQHFVEGEFFEIAGIIDNSKKTVSVSQHFSKETRNFTAAHELGHALLHQQTVLHRDKALEGSGTGNTRDPIELQADKFAIYFLMPKKQVKLLFKQLFLTEKFTINDDTMFGLNERSASAFKTKCRDLRGLTKFLASTEHFAGESFKSIAQIFRVSVETMAIRLEELDLVEF